MADHDFQTVLDQYNERAAREARATPQEVFARRDDYLLHVGEEAAHFLRALVVARGAKRILEIGTSYGYSTLFLADAARQTGGKVTTLELSGSKLAYARSQLTKASLASHVDWREGDALALLDRLDGPFDFVLLDLWKELYIPCFERFLPKLAENAIIAADNMLEPKIVRQEAEAYRAKVRTVASLQSVLLPVGQGIELSCLWRTPPSA